MISYVKGRLRDTPFVSAYRALRESAFSVCTAPVYRWQKRGAIIVNYHGVSPPLTDPDIAIHVPPDLFRKQIRHLKTYYKVVSLAELLDSLEAGYSIPSNWAVLTFDDGFRNNLTYAWQILREEGAIPISLFIITDFIGTNNVFWGDLIPLVVMCCRNQMLRVPCDENSWELRPLHTRRQREFLGIEIVDVLKSIPENKRQPILDEFFLQFGTGEIDEIRSRSSYYNSLSWDEVRFLHSNGVDVGSHTRTHAYMRPELGLKRMQEEIFGSREKIREELGKAPDHFCYPNGTRDDFCELSGRLLREAGYRCGLTTVLGTVQNSADPFELRRQIHISSMARFRTVVAAGKQHYRNF